MSKIVFRYFFDFMDGQERWLNRMAECGFRLRKCGKITYVFDKCEPDEYEYKVEFVGHRAYLQAKDYGRYLESMGFQTFTKNINLNYSFGKIKWRPYAIGLGQIATSPGGINKELLIIEKKRDDKPFELHTDLADKLDIYKRVKRAYAWAVLMILLLEVMTLMPNASSISVTMLLTVRIVLIFTGGLFLIPLVKYIRLVKCLKEVGKIYE